MAETSNAIKQISAEAHAAIQKAHRIDGDPWDALSLILGRMVGLAGLVGAHNSNEAFPADLATVGWAIRDDAEAALAILDDMREQARKEGRP